MEFKDIPDTAFRGVDFDAEILNELQEEQVPWMQHNFPGRSSLCPALGMVEELGELDDAISVGDRHLIEDAIADVTIFMADYCTSIGIKIGDVFRSANNKAGSFRSVMSFVGSFAHVALKHEQGIRKITKQMLEDNLAYIMLHVVKTSGGYGFDLVKTTVKIWEKVRTRDWKKNAETQAV